MVVVSGHWVKNVAPYPQINETIVIEKNETMAARAIFICLPNSHPFEERTLTLDEPVKVGRSVARSKPTSTNAIFDCKVLSRHHAVLWYENGKFYLQDTKSSNGTFVNNNRLSTENHEVSSGDIVQFGVDVVENNKKVTHGCIIATLKLYMPDGREAKASAYITEGQRQDELYELSQILQEANQREQCLETKLNALQHVIDETKKSADESWQAYVGEEKLLSRLSALEFQLQEARSNWSEDRLKEEIAMLRESNDEYQKAAKDALEKVHEEKLQAVALAVERERERIFAEQDAQLVREQLEQTRKSFYEILHELMEAKSTAEKEKQKHEKQVRELEQHIEEEASKVFKLEAKVYELTFQVSTGQMYEKEQQRPDVIFEDDLKTKEEILAENEEPMFNKFHSNCVEQNHISLTVAPVEEKCEQEKTEDLECETESKIEEECEIKAKDDVKKVLFNIPEKNNKEETQDGSQSPDAPEDDDYSSDHVDSKTLKYQYQSAQKEQTELRRKIEILEKISESNKTRIVELDKALNDEKELSGQRLVENECLREELLVLEQKWKKSCCENQILKDKVNELLSNIDTKKNDTEQEKREANSNETDEEKDNKTRSKEDLLNKQEYNDPELTKIEDLSNSVLSEPEQNSLVSNASIVSCEELMNLEEELVLLKEKYAQSCEDKVKLQRDLLKMRVQYDMMCDNMYNKYFLYIGPLILIVLYLLISAWIS